MPQVPDARMATVLRLIPRKSDSENHFFEDIRYFPGRLYVPDTNRVFQPQESLADYERVMAQIKRVDAARYDVMAKGTPFYIMGWLAYEMRDYERGVFYMDAAMSEDVHNNPGGWMTQPAASFLFLDDSNMQARAREITAQTRRVVDGHCARYSAASGVPITTQALVDGFIKPNATDPTHRSIVTSLLTSLLEGDERQAQLDLRSAHGGSLEPFLTHLFKGGLIFESILKRHYGGMVGKKVMDSYLAAGKGDLQLNKEVYKQGRPYELQNLPAHLQAWKSEPFHERAVAIVYAVRNTSGHDLGWQDIFHNPALYAELFQGIVDAIFWTIQKKHGVVVKP